MPSREVVWWGFTLRPSAFSTEPPTAASRKISEEHPENDPYAPRPSDTHTTRQIPAITTNKQPARRTEAAASQRPAVPLGHIMWIHQKHRGHNLLPRVCFQAASHTLPTCIIAHGVKDSSANEQPSKKCHQMPVSPGTGADLASEACMRITLEQLQHHPQNCRLIVSSSAGGAWRTQRDRLGHERRRDNGPVPRGEAGGGWVFDHTAFNSCGKFLQPTVGNQGTARTATTLVHRLLRRLHEDGAEERRRDEKKREGWMERDVIVICPLSDSPMCSHQLALSFKDSQVIRAPFPQHINMDGIQKAPWQGTINGFC
ncbi:hypothetical protein AOLI_G00313490 [Acnodon oligacanthus]